MLNRSGHSDMRATVAISAEANRLLHVLEMIISISGRIE
jgi:hypothetical protein